MIQAEFRDSALPAADRQSVSPLAGLTQMASFFVHDDSPFHISPSNPLFLTGAPSLANSRLVCIHITNLFAKRLKTRRSCDLTTPLSLRVRIPQNIQIALLD